MLKSLLQLIMNKAVEYLTTLLGYGETGIVILRYFPHEAR
jgi:hypothetical protein